MSTRTRDGRTDHYATLGVSPSASPDDIRRAYRTLARQLHPDRNSAPDAVDRFAAVADAYATLSDPERRRAYDLARAVSGPPIWGGAGIPETRHDGRAAAYGMEAPAKESSLRGFDIHQTVRLSVREAAFGTDKTIIVPRHDVCAVCHGSGAAPGHSVRQCPRCHGSGHAYIRGEACPHCHGNGGIPSVPCTACNGRGRIPTDDTFPLHFPPALEDGEVVRIKNQGEPGPQGGPRGDLHLHIEVEPDPVLRRKGSEVYATLTLTPDQAARGGAVEVPTLHGSKRVRLPRGVADGTTFTMRGQGLRLKGRWRRGHQHVTVRVRPAEHHT